MTCPYCKNDLGDLDSVMDELSLNKTNGEVYFNSICCNRAILAFSQIGMYYIVPAESLPADKRNDPQLIGAA